MAASHPNDAFRYPKLDYESEQIRVLKLEPSLSPDGYIQGTLESATLSGNHFAVSYVWGPETMAYIILINGKSVAIRRNLWLFLSVARTRYHNIPLWIDAICIDQSAMLERNHQVQLMGEIYADSKHVLVWLGSGDTDVEETLEMIARDHPTGVAQRMAQLSPMDRWLKCDKLCSLPYWTRIWIVQEFIQAPQKTLLYGNAECQELDLRFILNHEAVSNRNHGEGGMSVAFQTNAEVLCANAQHRRNGGGKMTLPECLMRHGDARGSDFHDVIYAFRSLFIGGESFPVDYSLTKLELLTASLLFCSMQRSPRASMSPQRTEWANYCRLGDILTKAFNMNEQVPYHVSEDQAQKLPFPPQKPVFNSPYLDKKILLYPNASVGADMFDPSRDLKDFPGDYRPALPPPFREALRAGDFCYWVQWASMLIFARVDGGRQRIFARSTVRRSPADASIYKFCAELYPSYIDGAYIQSNPSRKNGESSTTPASLSRLVFESTYAGVVLFGLDNGVPLRHNILTLLALNNQGLNHPDSFQTIRYQYCRVGEYREVGQTLSAPPKGRWELKFQDDEDKAPSRVQPAPTKRTLLRKGLDRVKMIIADGHPRH